MKSLDTVRKSLDTVRVERLRGELHNAWGTLNQMEALISDAQQRIRNALADTQTASEAVREALRTLEGC